MSKMKMVFRYKVFKLRLGSYKCILHINVYYTLIFQEGILRQSRLHKGKNSS